MKNFLLVDDHVVVRSGIKALLSEIYDPAEVHEAADGNATIELLKSNHYDLVILDIQMPDTDTLGLMKFIHEKHQEVKVLIFSMGSESIFAKRFLKAGAMGFVSKDSPLSDITNAINAILNNKKFMSEELMDRLAQDSIYGRPVNPFDKLSPKEFEIASLLLSGKTVTGISKSLSIHTSTVGTHKARLLEKLEVTNVLELSELAKAYLK